MSHPYPHLFSPIQFGSYTIKNRIMNTGHAAHFQTGDGLPTGRYVDYLRERAKGGVGIIVTGHTVPHPDGDAALSFANFDQRIVPIYRRLSDATHEFEVPLLAQLGHRGRRVSDASAFLGRAMKAPSAIPPPDMSVAQHVPHAMTTAEVEEVIEQFAFATRRVRQGGLDGVELAVGIDYLFANFLSESSNRRTDKYGGSTLAERMTFLYEVVDVVRDELGPDLILGIRFYDDLVDYSLRLDDYKQVARLMEQTGQVAYFNMWQGIVPSPRSGRAHWPSHYYAPGEFSHLPAGLKEVVSLPVVGAGRIDSPALAERLIAEGQQDLVGLAKTLIADPHFPNKAMEGRAEDIRTCIGCTQSCVGHIYLGLAVGCIYNPVTGREAQWAEPNPASVAKKVVVVGGGPAGMEAARVCAERGHRVVLYEKRDRLGGQVNLIIRTPKRDSFGEITGFMQRQLNKLGVEVRLRNEATAEAVLGEQPDTVIIATGSDAFRPDFLGNDRSNVLTAREVLEGNAPVGDRVVVVDSLGRAEGPSVAEYLADQGKQVEIVSGLNYIGAEMPPITWHHQMEQLMTKGVTLSPMTGAWEVEANSVEVYNVITWEPRTIENVDTVVLASGGIAQDALYHALDGKVRDLYLIGDCYQPRDIELAVVDGHRVARQI